MPLSLEGPETMSAGLWADPETGKMYNFIRTETEALYIVFIYFLMLLLLCKIVSDIDFTTLRSCIELNFTQKTISYLNIYILAEADACDNELSSFIVASCSATFASTFSNSITKPEHRSYTEHNDHLSNTSYSRHLQRLGCTLT